MFQLGKIRSSESSLVLAADLLSGARLAVLLEMLSLGVLAVWSIHMGTWRLHPRMLAAPVCGRTALDCLPSACLASSLLVSSRRVPLQP